MATTTDSHPTTAERHRRVEHGPRTGETILFLHGANAAGWTWTMQVEGLPERHLLTPDLPGYAGRADEPWPGLAAAADDIAELVRERALGGQAHVVGLSLGGFVAVHLLQRHPGLVRSCAVTGSALSGYSRWEGALVSAQAPLWRRGWYWTAQAAAFRIPAEDRPLYVMDAAAPSDRTNRAMLRDVLPHRLPTGFAYDGPLLAVAAQHDSASVRRSFPALSAALPHAQTWIAPGVHHAWSAERPDLFNHMVTQLADTGRWLSS